MGRTVFLCDIGVEMSRTNDTHSKLIGYALWLLGFSGAHRFYYGRPLTGILWFFTGGFYLIGWMVDFFLIPSMVREADFRYQTGRIDYSIAWLLLTFLGAFGIHRFYQGKIGTGLLYLCTFGLLGFGILYDFLTLNDQIDEQNSRALLR
jgi:TM2 domain-containing membrane protein YozV